MGKTFKDSRGKKSNSDKLKNERTRKKNDKQFSKELKKEIGR